VIVQRSTCVLKACRWKLVQSGWGVLLMRCGHRWSGCSAFPQSSLSAELIHLLSCAKSLI
jgi:hypothetical protein